MDEKRTIQLIEVPIGGKGGWVWNRLHGEREDVCEALIQEAGSPSDERRNLLEGRLRQLDDALDLLMSGSHEWPSALYDSTWQAEGQIALHQ